MHGRTDARESGPLRVVLVDDQALVRAGFAMVIDSQLDLTVVGQAGDGAAGLDIVRQDEPDVVLMDVRMPRIDGIEATQRILALADEGTIRPPKIIVLTTFDDDDYALRALRAGASGFLLKDTLPEVLLESIRTGRRRWRRHRSHHHQTTARDTAPAPPRRGRSAPFGSAAGDPGNRYDIGRGRCAHPARGR